LKRVNFSRGKVQNNSDAELAKQWKHWLRFCSLAQDVRPTQPTTQTRSLRYPDAFHLSAAEGWLALGSPEEARVELNRIAPALRLHPDVLYVRWQLFARLHDWNRCVAIARALCEHTPQDSRGWIALARSFREKGQFERSYRAAAVRVARFPASWQILYETACYACLTGRRKQAEQYLALAEAIGDAKTIKRWALNDPDLEDLKNHLMNRQPARRIHAG
jgi:hypothetical protein